MNQQRTYQTKKDYRKIQDKISEPEREEIKARAYRVFPGGQVAIAKVLKKSPYLINCAFAGQSDKTMLRIKNLVEKYEQRASKNSIQNNSFTETGNDDRDASFRISKPKMMHDKNEVHKSLTNNDK